MTAVTITDLNNAKTDVNHIAEVSNSTALTATDRQGHVKDTVAGAMYKIGGITNRGAWAGPGTVYASKDIVSQAGTWYICTVAHTSSALFATDAANWRVYQGVTTGDLSAPSGSSLVGFQQAGTGAVPRTMQDKGRDVVSVLDFYANGVSGVKVDPTGAVESSAGFQAAVDTGKAVYVPTGDYWIGAAITKNNNAAGEGLVLTGDGMDKTVLLCDFSAASMTGSTAQGVINLHATVVSDYLRGTRISGLTIKPKPATAHTNTHGILANCQFFPIFEQVRVVGMPGSGFYSPLRTDLSANPDTYQNTLMQFRSCEFDGNEYGWYGESGLGCAATTLKGCYIANSRRSGVRGGGVLGVIENCAIAANGVSGTLAGVDTCGVIIDVMNGTTSRNWSVRNSEFESNYNANLWVRSCAGFESENLRLNSQVSTDAGVTVITPVQVLLGDAGTSVRSARFKGDVSKSTPAWAATLAMYKIRGADTATVDIIEPVGIASSDNTAGFVAFDTSTTTGALDGVHMLRAGIWSQSRSWSKEPLARVYASAGVVIPTGANTIIICNTELVDNASAHNSTTGTFTVPSVGIYRVTASFQTQTPVAAKTIILRIRRSGGALAERKYITRGEAFETYQIDDVINCATAGDTLTVEMNQNTGGNLTLDGGFTAGGITFERVG